MADFPRPTPQQAALLAAILTDPGEALPRLAYADWLDEHGDPARAEFIRVQCELASPNRSRCACFLYGCAELWGDDIGPDSCACEPHRGAVRLKSRERELFDQFGQKWFTTPRALQAARADISQVCVIWALEAAGSMQPEGGLPHGA